MDFFAAQEQARRRTTFLVVYYALAVAGIIGAIYLLFAYLLHASGPATVDGSASLWMPDLFVWVALGTGGLILGASFFKTLQLSGGGAAVARSLGGRPVDPGTRDPDERKLLNVVEEMALSAGTGVPQVYLLDDETGINAFAAGFSPRDAVIGVTRGCMEQLSRDELQGVIAHEFSHIVNGDMRLNIRLMGILFGILMLTIVGRILLRTAWVSGGSRPRRSGRKEGVNPLPFIGLALILIGYIGVFFANLIKSAVSRQREFLSDASAVQYTRNPSGIAGALRKIGGVAHGARVNNVHATEAAHLFFGNALGQGFAGLFATHPPLAERIRRLDPSSNPHLAEWMSKTAPVAGAGTSGFAQGVAGHVDLGSATRMMRQVPEDLLDGAHTQTGARALIYALLWSPDPAIHPRQEAALDLDPQARGETEQMRSRVDEIDPAGRLPLAELAVPALRMMPRDAFDRFRRTMQALIDADQQVSLFEFALHHMILRHVEPAFGRVGKAPVRIRTMEKALPACTIVLRALAMHGAENESEAADAYNAAAQHLGVSLPSYDPQKTVLKDLGNALAKLAEATPSIRMRILDACATCVMHSGRVVANEQTLLRTIADALDVPLPPLSATHAA